MPYLVIPKSVLAELDVTPKENDYIFQDTHSQEMLDRVVMEKGRWLNYGRHTGELVNFDPDVDIQVGMRLALNCDGKVNPLDVFYTELIGLPSSTFAEVFNHTFDNITKLATESHEYTAAPLQRRGWMYKHVDNHMQLLMCVVVPAREIKRVYGRTI